MLTLLRTSLPVIDPAEGESWFGERGRKEFFSINVAAGPLLSIPKGTGGVQRSLICSTLIDHG